VGVCVGIDACGEDDTEPVDVIVALEPDDAELGAESEGDAEVDKVLVAAADTDTDAVMLEEELASDVTDAERDARGERLPLPDARPLADRMSDRLGEPE
jgi:hypothetical protein